LTESNVTFSNTPALAMISGIWKTNFN